MSLAALQAKVRAKARRVIPTARKAASKCGPLVAQRNALDKRIAAIAKKNAEARRKAEAKVEAKRKAAAAKVEAEHKRELAKIDAQFGKVCTASDRKPRKDKGAKKGSRGKAANGPGSPTTPAATPAKKAAKKASKRGGKAKSPEPEPSARALGTHAQALLPAFEAGRPVFEAEVQRSIPLADLPLSLRGTDQLAAALEELQAAGLILPWAPPVGAPADKPHPKLPLRRYWPAGRIWQLASKQRSLL